MKSAEATLPAVQVKPRRRHNSRPWILLLLIPVLEGILTIALVASGLYYNYLAHFGSSRLVTDNWQNAVSILQKAQPDYTRKYAYYQIKRGQTPASLASYFGISQTKLEQMNPGTFAADATIKIPPLEKPLEATASNGRLGLAEVTDDHGMLRVEQKYYKQLPIVTDLPQLADFLAPYNAISKLSPGVYRVNRPISIEGDIRLNILGKDVSKIELTSSATNVTCLCFDESSALIKGVSITSYDPAKHGPDKNLGDGRSFVRMKNGRMDVIDSRFSYLGNDLATLAPNSQRFATQRDGGVYGVSWRIAGDRLGQQIATGWVQGSHFEHNFFGAYTFGASGMHWQGNTFAHNQVYGLDPHDDSNNALIENNVFAYNGKHGFIVSKRCDYNIIKNNLSLGNAKNGFMLHDNSEYNLIEGNIASGNGDNYVIFNSNFNTIKDNKSYSPRSSHIRVNSGSADTYVIGNQMYGGDRALHIYGGVENVLVRDNTIQDVSQKIQTDGADNIVFANNNVNNINFDINGNDRMVFGPNDVTSEDVNIPKPAELLANFQ